MSVSYNPELSEKNFANPQRDLSNSIHGNFVKLSRDISNQLYDLDLLM